MTVSYDKRVPAIEQLIALYADAGWESYTRAPETLLASIQNSQDVISAWDGEKLVGLIRTVGDKATILYIQDILVLKAYKRNGIGRQLVTMLLNDYPEIRQVVLLTDDTEESRKFYESLGFTACDKGEQVAFVRLK